MKVPPPHAGRNVVAVSAEVNRAVPAAGEKLGGLAGGAPVGVPGSAGIPVLSPLSQDRVSQPLCCSEQLESIHHRLARAAL